MSGPRNPYPGEFGVIQECALADLLLVDGDPISNIKLLEDPSKNLVVIMKDGKIYKNVLSKCPPPGRPTQCGTSSRQSLLSYFFMPR